MNLRIALKIYAAIDTPDELRYRAGTVRRAIRRVARTRTAREAWRDWTGLVGRLGMDRRAQLLVRLGEPGMVFKWLRREGD